MINLNVKLTKEKLSAKCSYHSGRGRPPDHCRGCDEARLIFNAEKKQGLASTNSVDLTRAKGRDYVVDVLYPKKRAELRAETDKTRNQISEEWEASTLQFRQEYSAFEKMHIARMEPFNLAANQAREALERAQSRSETDIDRWKNEALENLETRCYVTDRHGKECLKFLDYTGACPKHGAIGKPGEA